MAAEYTFQLVGTDPGATYPAPEYGPGTISSAGTAVTGVGTLFLTGGQTAIAIGDTIHAPTGARHVVAVLTDTTLTVDYAWPANLVSVVYSSAPPAFWLQGPDGSAILYADGFLTLNDSTVPGPLLGTIGGAIVHLSIDNGALTTPVLQMDGYGSAGGSGPQMRTRQARGTQTAPTATQNNDSLFQWNMSGRGATTALDASTKAKWSIVAGETWTDTASGTYMTWETTPVGSITRATNMRLQSPGLSIGGGNTIAAEMLDVTGNIQLKAVGNKHLIKEGTNASMGVATLVGGTVVVSNTLVTANSRIFLTAQTPGGTVGSVYISARTAATSFTITSVNVLDTSVIAWHIIEPAP